MFLCANANAIILESQDTCNESKLINTLHEFFFNSGLSRIGYRTLYCIHCDALCIKQGHFLDIRIIQHCLSTCTFVSLSKHVNVLQVGSINLQTYFNLTHFNVFKPTCRLIKRNTLSFTEPVREGVNKLYSIMCTFVVQHLQSLIIIG